MPTFRKIAAQYCLSTDILIVKEGMAKDTKKTRSTQRLSDSYADA